MTEFQITPSRSIGDGQPVFVIAEIGNNHQGRMELALKAIEAAAVAGADAVTFQYAPIGTYAVKAFHDDPRLAFLKECELTPEQLGELAAAVRGHGLSFAVNVEDAETLDLVQKIGIDFIKLCSADLTNLPHLRDCARRGLPVFFSTGGAWIEEIEVAFRAMREAGLDRYVVYHTNSGYPTPVEDAHLLQMDTLYKAFGGVPGYCDHTVEIIPSVVAAARGAKVIEKHITTSRALKGDDWMVSLEPEEFATMVRYIRQAEAALGSPVKKPLPIEEATRTFKRKSLVSRRAIRKGEILSAGDFLFKVPSTGISPVDLDRVIGRCAAVEIEEDVIVTPEMIEGWS